MKLDLDRDYYMNLWLDTYQQFSLFGKKEELTTEQINLCKRCINFLSNCQTKVARTEYSNQRRDILYNVSNNADLRKLMNGNLSISNRIKKIKNRT